MTGIPRDPVAGSDTPNGMELGGRFHILALGELHGITKKMAMIYVMFVEPFRKPCTIFSHFYRWYKPLPNG